MASIPNNSRISVPQQLPAGVNLSAPTDLANSTSFDQVLQASQSTTTPEKVRPREEQSTDSQSTAESDEQPIRESDRPEDVENAEASSSETAEEVDQDDPDEDEVAVQATKVEVADETQVVTDEAEAEVNLTEGDEVIAVDAEAETGDDEQASDADETSLLDETEGEVAVVNKDRRSTRAEDGAEEGKADPGSTTGVEEDEGVSAFEGELPPDEGDDGHEPQKRKRPSNSESAKEVSSHVEEDAPGPDRQARSQQTTPLPAPEADVPKVDGDARANDAQPTATAKVADQAGPATQPRWQQQLTGKVQNPATDTRPVQVDTGRFLTRVTRAFQAARNQDGEIRLRLSPPELGSLRLEVKVQGGALSARIEAETPAARALLVDNVAALRDRLAEQGIRIEQFDVDLMDRQSDDLQQSSDDTRGDQQRGDSDAGRSERPAASSAQSEEAISDQTETSLDVKRLDVTV